MEAGEFLGIMGASGSGKTTLLNCISTIDTVSAGHIFLDGTDITEIKPKSLARFRRENSVSYTHLIAISNHRIIRMDDETVTFFVKDYRNKGEWKELTVSSSMRIMR